MPDFNSTVDSTVAQVQQDAVVASQVEAVWRIMLMIGTGLLITLAVATFILGAFWLSESWRRTPPPPRSIIPQQPDRRWRYTDKTRR
jgi:hypothetical protein